MTFHNMGWHGINWEFMAVYDQPRLLKSSELPFFGDEKWGSWSPWLKDSFVLVCFGDFGGQVRQNGTA